MDVLKTCCRCGKSQPSTREYFYADKRASDGLYGHCKECHNAQGRKRYIGERREKTLATQRQYRKDFPERRKEAHKRYYLKHREKCLANARRYQQTNKGKEYLRAYRKRNSERYRIHTHMRLAKIAGLPNTLTKEQWQYALDYFGGCCAVCGRSLYGVLHTPAIDHWIPISDPQCPGLTVANAIPLCHGIGGCNNSKNDRNPEEWLVATFGKKRAKVILARILAYIASVIN